MSHKQEVTLGERVYPTVQTRLSAYIKNGALVLEGQDVGPGVSLVWGDTDYEYWVTVEEKHLDRLLAALARKLKRSPPEVSTDTERNEKILVMLKDSFESNVFNSDADYRRWLNAVHIPNQRSSYA